MNLLFTITAYPPSLGGAQLLTHQLARTLLARHTVRVVTQWDEHRTDWLLGTTLNAPRPAKAYTLDGVPVQRLALSETVRRRLWPWVVGYYAWQTPALARIAEALANEINPFASGVDLIHNCRIGREGLSYASLKVARARGLPFVFTPVHHPRWGGWLHRHYHQLYRQAEAVIALTEVERQILIALGVDERRIFVTGMGPVLAETAEGARFRAKYQLTNMPLVLFLGQKYAYKGAAILLQAATRVWQRHPETRFVFIGPRTPYSRRLFAQVTEEARIVELGAVNLQDKTDALAACDIFCLPSAQESFGGVYTEAWSFGKPVIGCDIQAVRAVIEDEHDGYLIPPQPGPLAERLLFLLGHPEVRQQMGQAGKAKVEARYTWSRLAEKTEHVYRQVLGLRADG